MSPLKDHKNDDLLDLADANDVAVPGGKSANKDTIIEALEAAGVSDDALDEPAGDDDPVDDADDDQDDAADADEPEDEDDDDALDVDDALDDQDDLEPNAEYGAALGDIPSVGPEAAKRVGDNHGGVPARVETGDAGEIKTWWCGKCGRSHTVEFDVCEGCNTPALGIIAVEPEVVIHDDAIDDDD